MRNRCESWIGTLLLSLAFLCLVPGIGHAREPREEPGSEEGQPPAAEEPVAAQDDKPQPAAERHWITLLDATPAFKDDKMTLRVSGATSLPDGTMIDFRVERQGFAAESLFLSTRAANRRFETTTELDRKVLPAYYVMIAAFTVTRQDEPVRTELSGVPDIKAIFPLVVGTAEEIDKVRENALETYKKSVDFVSDSFDRMKKKYLELVELGDSFEAGRRWNAEFEKLPVEIAKRRNGFEDLKNQYFLPPLPVVHLLVFQGLGVLESVFGELTNGLVTEITQEMIQKGWTRQKFLEEAEKKISDYLKTMLARFALERDATLLDLLVHQSHRLFCLLEDSRNLFDVLSSSGEADAGLRWSSFMTGCEPGLTKLDKDLDLQKQTEWARSHPELSRAILEAPGALRDYWRLCGIVLVDGVPLQKNIDAIMTAYTEAFKRIVPVMEILGFNREEHSGPVGTSEESPTGAPR